MPELPPNMFIRHKDDVQIRIDENLVRDNLPKLIHKQVYKVLREYKPETPAPVVLVVVREHNGPGTVNPIKMFFFTVGDKPDFYREYRIEHGIFYPLDYDPVYL